MRILPPALAAFAAWRQFIVWQLVPSVPKPDKVPLDWRTKYAANAHDSDIWLSFDEASRVAQQFGDSYGVGFVFTDADPFWFLDIDNALHDGQWSPVAQQLVQAFPGAAVEVSSSGKGLHIFGSGQVPEHGCKNKAFGLELYHTERFVALTGFHAQGDAATNHAQALDWLVKSYFVRGSAGVEVSEISSEPVPEWRGPTDDADLVRRASLAKSARALMGTGATFADLWTRNVPVLAKVYPSDTGKEFNESGAEMALMQHLAFWTGKHGTRMVTLMQQSALKREKWVSHRGYLKMTCLAALSRQATVCIDKLPEPVPGPSAGPQIATVAVQREVQGSTFLSPSQQVAIFSGCVYVSDAHAVLVPGGDLLDSGRFRVKFGGFTYAMDAANERTTRNAWEAFTESQALRPPVVDATCFRPELEAGAVVTTSGRSEVNTWWPINIERAPGNAKPFLDHLAKLQPDPRDAQLLLCYLAACVQHKGVKFQWAPFIQGVEGNGKTFFSLCLMNAVGMRYSHMPRPQDISSKFNPWLRGKLVIAIEDVYAEHERTEIFEMLKPMITGRMQPVEPKGVDQVLAQICCNFVFNSNHPDGMRKTPNDRRIAPFFCAQQQARDLVTCGMTRDYFRNLYGWYEHGGMSVVNELLATYPIPDEMNPAQGGIAPVTSSTTAAIGASMSAVEQHIIEAIQQGVIGFAGGWVSSHYLDRLLDEKGYSRRAAPNKRRALMQTLGYDLHPALPSGRVLTIVMPDATKPQLYIREGHVHVGLTMPAAVAQAYASAQVPGMLASV